MVYALLGQYEDSRDWLYRSYPAACADVDDAVDRVIASFAALPKVKSSVKGAVGEASIPGGMVAIFQQTPPRQRIAAGSHPPGTRLVRCVRTEPLQSALTALAQAKLAVVNLRSACLETDSRGVDAYEIPSRVEAGDAMILVPSQSKRWDSYIVCGPDGRAFAPAAVLADIWTWRVTVVDVPVKRRAKVFVSGSIPEFGGWRRDRALPLIKTEPGRWYSWHTQAAQPVEYAYFIVTPGAKPIWEPGPRRTLAHLDGIEVVDRWRRKGKAKRGKSDAPLPPAFIDDGPGG